MEVRTIVHLPSSSLIATRWKPSTFSSSSSESGSERPKLRPQNDLPSRQRKRTRRNEDEFAGRQLFDARGGACGARVVTTEVKLSTAVGWAWGAGLARCVQSGQSFRFPGDALPSGLFQSSLAGMRPCPPSWCDGERQCIRRLRLNRYIPAHGFIVPRSHQKTSSLLRAQMNGSSRL